MYVGYIVLRKFLRETSSCKTYIHGKERVSCTKVLTNNSIEIESSRGS